MGSGGLGEDASWPVFGPQAADVDVHSALSLPLIVNGDVLGALNVYAHAHNAFAGTSQRLGERFAASAAVVIHNARLFDQAPAPDGAAAGRGDDPFDDRSGRRDRDGPFRDQR